MAQHLLFEDIFSVNKLNPDGKKFDRVNRLACKGLTYETELLLDINCEIYSVMEGDKITFVLASTLDLDGAPDDGTYRMLDQGSEVTLADQYEYVMHGRVFKYNHVAENKVEVLASFGGLLMRLSGEQRHLASIRVDSRVYCLIRKQLRVG
ncbi:unnamed protein product [Phaeothamnion confervicola]